MDQTKHTPHKAGRGETHGVLADASDSTTSPISLPILPNSSRLLRVLSALATGKDLSHAQLSKIGGQLNGPDLVYQLKKRGWKIPCKRVRVIDRDGGSAYPGRWYLDRDQIQIAYELLAERQGGAG